jgi:hypothetical protein
MTIGKGLLAGCVVACVAGLTGCDKDGVPGLSGSASGEPNYTILLKTFTGDDHIETSEYYRKSLAEKLQWEGVFVVNGDSHSELFWGKYATIDQAEANLKRAKTHTTQRDNIHPFEQAHVVPLPGGDVGPPEWNLKHAKGEYTLLVALFEEDPEQKIFGHRKNALDYCKKLRDKGYEAYYLHTPGISDVTIGAFPASAVTVKKTADREELIINDLRLKGIQSDFPLLSYNGFGINDRIQDPKTGKMVTIPRETRLVRIPKDDDKAKMPAGMPAVPPAGAPPATPPGTPPRPAAPAIP